jgi:hypothetical protein
LSMNSDEQAEAGTKLVFRIHVFWARGHRKTWGDRAKRPWRQLNGLIAALVELSAAIRKERLECERRSAAIHEEFRQREVERARRQQIESDLKSWRVAVDLRALIAKCCIRPRRK